MENPIITRLILQNRLLHNAIKKINIITHHGGTGLEKKNKDIILLLEKLMVEFNESEQNFNDCFLFQERSDKALLSASEFVACLGHGFFIYNN